MRNVTMQMMKKPCALTLAVLLLFACAVPAFAAGRETEARLTAHRGYSDIAPENTLPAFRLAGEHGFWGAECDTSPTADGVWVVMHDGTVDRMTDGEGEIKNLTFDEIRAMTVDAGNNVEQYPGTQVPTLTEYLDVCREFGMHPVIEIKTNATVEDMESLAALLGAREEKDAFVIITFGADLAVRIKQLMPQTPVYYLIGSATEEEFDAGVRLCADNGIDGIDFACTWDKAHVRAIQKAGLKTMVWTVDDQKTAERYYALGVRDVTTNRLTPPFTLSFEGRVWAFVETRLPFLAPVSWDDVGVPLYLTAVLCGLAVLLFAAVTAVFAAAKKRARFGLAVFGLALLAAAAGTWASYLFILWDKLPLYAAADAVFLLSVAGAVFAAVYAKNGFACPKGRRGVLGAAVSLFIAAAPYEIAVLVINTLIHHGRRPTFSITLSAFVQAAVLLAALAVIFVSLARERKAGKKEA